MKYIVGNWKMNLVSKDALLLAKQISDFVEKIKDKDQEIVICPSFTYISMIANEANDILKIGAQDCSVENQGAYTGEISADMLSDIGCSYVIVGHSERRQYHNETSEIVRNKAMMAYKNNIQPIICVGESLEHKKANKTFDILSSQLEESIPTLKKDQDLIIAYEPVWAIGSGMKPEEKDIEEVADFIRELISDKFVFTKRVKILYGGSVNEKNCHDIINLKNIDGLLIGGASLESDSFINIIKNCKEVK